MLLTVREAAELLRVRPSTITKWVRQGILPAIKIGAKTIRIPEDALNELYR